LDCPPTPPREYPLPHAKKGPTRPTMNDSHRSPIRAFLPCLVVAIALCGTGATGAQQTTV